MAEGGEPVGGEEGPSWEEWLQNLQEQTDEVMALESIYGETGPLRVVSRPDEEQKKGSFSLEVDIEVSLPEEGVTVEMWVPYEQDSASPQGPSTAGVPVNKRPNFMRSESGRKWHSAFPVSHLPSLSLYITLPPTYPSDGPPVFTLSGLWLDAGQLSDLCAQLDRLWADTLGMPVVYAWVDWLQTNLLSFLGLEKSVILTPYLEGDDAMLGVRDPRALPECSNVTDDMVRLIEYDCCKQWEAFRKADHECSVCFMEYPGDQFYVIDGCDHSLCRECMTEYCVMHVSDGTVHQLKCPHQKCTFSVTPEILRDVLGDEAYTRWERLCLKKALETMEDVEWCPRCNSAVIRDTDETQAYCTTCFYSFCPRCREPFHSKSPCAGLEAQLIKIEKETKRIAEDLGVALEDIAEDAKISESDALRVSQEKLRRLRAEYLSKIYIKENAKKCLKCKVPIEKNGGCNKVTCSNCGTHICWICFKIIQGYKHFNSEGAVCALFPGQNGDGNVNVNPLFNWLQQRQRPEGADQAREAMDRGDVASIMCCTRCRQRNLRNGRNNHIKCWSCKTNMCFTCKQTIHGAFSTHYALYMPCQQHGDS